MDGEIEDTFYRQNVSLWRKEQEKILGRIKRHQDADQNYIEQGIKLLELAQNARNIFRNRDENARTELLRFVMPDSMLEKDTVHPVFKPPFDIIRRMAEDAGTIPVDEKTAAPLNEAARIILLPRLDSNFSG